MQLFDEKGSDPPRSNDYNNSEFNSLNLSPRPEDTEVRRVLTTWYRDWPTNQRSAIRTRFRSNDSSEHYSATAELFLNELLLRSGYILDYEPIVPESNHHPDFLVKFSTLDQFYLEVTSTKIPFKDNQLDNNRVRHIIDMINKYLVSERFSLIIALYGNLNSELSKNELLPPIYNWLRGLESSVDTNNLDIGLILHIGGLVLDIQAITKELVSNQKDNTQIVSAVSSESIWIKNSPLIRKVLKRKATEYPNVVPYIIALSIPRTVTEADVVDALFGDTEYGITRSVEGGPITEYRRRHANGLWRAGGRSPAHTRVSGVLFVSGLNSWSAAAVEATLILNPWATKALESEPLLALDRIECVEGKFVRTRGRSAHEILGLPKGWPRCPIE